MVDRAVRYLAVSHRWMQDYALHDPIIGRSHYGVFPDLPEPWHVVHRRCLADATEHVDAEHFQRADGTEQWLRWTVYPWYDNTNRGRGPPP